MFIKQNKNNWKYNDEGKYLNKSKSQRPKILSGRDFLGVHLYLYLYLYISISICVYTLLIGVCTWMSLCRGQDVSVQRLEFSIRPLP